MQSIQSLYNLYIFNIAIRTDGSITGPAKWRTRPQPTMPRTDAEDPVDLEVDEDGEPPRNRRPSTSFIDDEADVN